MEAPTTTSVEFADNMGNHAPRITATVEKLTVQVHATEAV